VGGVDALPRAGGAQRIVIEHGSPGRGHANSVARVAAPGIGESTDGGAGTART
jgi:hypothetical protein